MTPIEYNDLLTFHYSKLLRTARNRWGDVGDDVLQEAALRAYTRLSLYDNSKPFCTWMYIVMQNVYRNMLDADKSEIDRSVDVLDLVGDDDVVENAHLLEWASSLSRAELAGVLEDTNRMALYRARKKYES